MTLDTDEQDTRQRKIYQTMKVHRFSDFISESSSYRDWRPDSSVFADLINNARKWKEDDFVDEYMYLYGLNTKRIVNSIKPGDRVEIGLTVRDKSGKRVYGPDGMQVYADYKTVVADRTYSDVWQFIKDSCPEIASEARDAWRANRTAPKPKFKKDRKTVTAYHASPRKFTGFDRAESVSGQLGADLGFFFFLDRRNAKYYASVLKDNHGSAYLYEVLVNPGRQLELHGADIGTNWTRYSELEQAAIEGYDSVIIRQADTGYGVTDELVVFDDDSIKIINIEKI